MGWGEESLDTITSADTFVAKIASFLFSIPLLLAPRQKRENPKRERGPLPRLWRKFQKNRNGGPRSRFGFSFFFQTATPTFTL